MTDLEIALERVKKEPQNHLVGYGATTKIAALAMANNLNVIYSLDFQNAKEATKVYEIITALGIQNDGRFSTNISNGVYILKK